MKKYKKELKKALPRVNFNERTMLPTGFDQLNLAISDSINGGLPVGTYTRVCGDSDAGKTFVALAILAEASIHPDFKKYRLIYDPVENGAMMDLDEYYGEELASRIECPRIVDGEGVASEHVEDFYHNLTDAMQKKIPFIYVLDSMDALETKAGLKLSEENKKKRDTGKQEKETYGTDKARINSKKLGPVVAQLNKTGSILIIVSQSRENISAIGYGNKQTASGGKALNFHAAVNIWLSKKETLKKKVGNKDRKIGMVAAVKVVRTRLTGKKHVVDMPILYSYGIDNTDANIDYLLEEGTWKKVGGKIKATGVSNNPMFKNDLIEYIERKGKQRRLRRLVAKTWRTIQEGCATSRVNKYKR